MTACRGATLIIPGSPAPPAGLRTEVAPAELTVVVPCRNEAENVPAMAERLSRALAGIAWEVVFVDDDSPDGTAAVAEAIARRDPRVRCIRRIHRRGLASACLEGMLASAAPFLR
jgi:dolichol-phosphate mannosyltransferase